jgi:farnesyl diphosphate synthase
LHSLAGVTAIQRMKTGALIRFSAEAGAILARAPPAQHAALRNYGEALGAAFQIADDLLDAEGDSAEMGKAAGKDAARGKANFVTLLGAEGARERVQFIAAQARSHLGMFGSRAKTLAQSIDFVLDRRR